MALRIRYELLVGCILVLPSTFALADEDPGGISGNAWTSTLTIAAGTDSFKPTLRVAKPARDVGGKLGCVTGVLGNPPSRTASLVSTDGEMESRRKDDDACGSTDLGALGGTGGPDTAGASTGSAAGVPSGSGSSAQALPTPSGRGGPRTHREAVLSNLQRGFDITPSRSRLPSCFLPGTRILTPNGERKIEDLKIGDVVSTKSGEQRIKFVPKQVFSKAEGEQWGTGIAPIRIHEGALGSGLPNRTLLLSAQHALYLDGSFVEAGKLVNGSTIVRDDTDLCLEYLTIELEGHDLIWANGVLVETFRPAYTLSREAFDNFADFVERYPGEEYKSFPAYAAHRKAGLIARVNAAVRNRDAHGCGPLAACSAR